MALIIQWIHQHPAATAVMAFLINFCIGFMLVLFSAPKKEKVS
ncbi:MAG: hypothetical protein AB1426_04695 [Bacillota bacterium]